MFDEFEEKQSLPWLKSSSVLAPIKRLKFSREMDFDTDDEIIDREQKKCFGDLRSAINRFVKEDPADLIANFTDNLETLPESTPTNFSQTSNCLNPEGGEPTARINFDD